MAFPPASIFATSSDDEESFVILGSSLPPESYVALGENQLLDGCVVDEAVSLAQTNLSNLSGSTMSFPSLPKISDKNLILLADRLHMSKITTISSVDLGPDEIQQKVDLLVEENIKLKETLHQNNLAMKNQYETLVAWQEAVRKVHQSHKEKFAETKIFIENLKIENARLTKSLALEQSKPKEIVTAEVTKPYNEMVTMARYELETALNRIASLEAQISQLENEKLASANSHVLQNDMTSQTENLQAEFYNVKEIHQKEILKYQKQLHENENVQKILLEEIKTLRIKNVEHSRCLSLEKVENIQQQLRAAQMHITNLEQIQKQDMEVINEKEVKIIKLEKEIQEIKEVTKAQLDEYTADFEAEHQQRITISREKEELILDLQQLQRRNKQLLEEIERIRPSDFVHVEQRAAPSAPVEASKWVCPKCSVTCSDYQTLENHVFKCIEIDSLI